MKISMRLEKAAVKKFLQELKEILTWEDFSIDRNLLIVKSRKERAQYSTPFTLVGLGYDTHDIVDRLRELSIEEYSETLVDRDNSEPPLLFVFGKEIKGRQVYIKLKVKAKRRSLCLSFHYAEYRMEHPYQ
ncbi:hypothetical protein D3Z38_15550 [Clostridiales bacterium]|nr:hypothetical protein [Clostridiales bacterium]